MNFTIYQRLQSLFKLIKRTPKRTKIPFQSNTPTHSKRWLLPENCHIYIFPNDCAQQKLIQTLQTYQYLTKDTKHLIPT